jgi:hypothetical protein
MNALLCVLLRNDPLLRLVGAVAWIGSPALVLSLIWRLA